MLHPIEIHYVFTLTTNTSLTVGGVGGPGAHAAGGSVGDAAEMDVLARAWWTSSSTSFLIDDDDAVWNPSLSSRSCDLPMDVPISFSHAACFFRNVIGLSRTNSEYSSFSRIRIMSRKVGLSREGKKLNKNVFHFNCTYRLPYSRSQHAFMRSANALGHAKGMGSLSLPAD